MSDKEAKTAKTEDLPADVTDAQIVNSSSALAGAMPVTAADEARWQAEYKKREQAGRRMRALELAVQLRASSWDPRGLLLDGERLLAWLEGTSPSDVSTLA